MTLVTDIKSFFSFLNPSNIKGWFNYENIFVNYFWFFSLCSIPALIFHRNALFSLGFPVLLYLMVAKKLNIKSINYIDILWIANFLWIIVTWLINDYPNQETLILVAIVRDLSYMMAYWITRCSNEQYVQTIIRKAEKPLIIGCIVGIYCFFFEPIWYQNAIDYSVATNYTVAENYQILEQHRLRSFYQNTYVLAYFCAIVLIYELYPILANRNNNQKKIKINYHLLYISLLIVTAILCMMRAPFACFLLSFVFYFVFFADRNRMKIFFIGTIIVSIAFIFFNSLDASITDFLIGKITYITENKSSISGRLFLQAKSFSMCGEGYGRYASYAHFYLGMPCIVDGEYMKIISEQGFIGLIISGVMFSVGLLKSLINRKKLHFEFCIMVMLAITMIGACPLSGYEKHSFLFWMVLGQISKYNNK